MEGGLKEVGTRAPQPFEHARVLFAAMSGTAIEFYDFFIYATAAALVFGPLFFPSEVEGTQTLLAFMSFGIAFFARPVGAIAFGHFGDRLGRKSTLVASLMLMGISTLLIAFLPTYAVVGWVAPLLLCILRFGQGFGLGGEWGGAALLAAEYAPPGKEHRYVSIMQLGSPFGFLLANGVFLTVGWLTGPEDFMAWGWRIPFVLSALLVVIGLYVRFTIEETPRFREAIERKQPERFPFMQLMRTHGGAMLAGAAGVVATFALFYLSTAFALSLGTGTFGYGREEFLSMQMGASLLYILGILLAGIASDRIGAGRVIGWAGAATVLVGAVFELGLGAGELWLAGLTLAFAMLVLGFANAPLGGWLATLFPVRLRYSGVSFAFNLGGIIGGALSPIAAQALHNAGIESAASWILVAAGLLTIVGVFASRRPGAEIT